MQTELIWIIQGYEAQQPTGELLDVVWFEIKAQTEKEALDKAKKYLKKKFYRVARIIEK